MSKARVKYKHLSESRVIQKEEISWPRDDFREVPFDDFEKNFQENPNIFFLNNILMGVQFFENYDRDVRILRDTWFRDTVLEKHHKKCFYADSLLLLAGKNLKFQPQHGPNKNVRELLQPVRLYISSDNVEAAYDPSAFGRKKPDVFPHYQFTVKPCENNKKEKFGYVSLVEFKTLESPADNSKSIKNAVEPWVTMRSKLPVDLKNVRRPTNGFQNNAMTFQKQGILKHSPPGGISTTGYYHYVKPEARLKPKPIGTYRMNNVPQTSHQIPRKCFQAIDPRKGLNPQRRLLIITKDPMGDHLQTRHLLNSAAFKGHFCDVLIEKLGEDLGLDEYSLNDALVHQEFVCVNQNGHNVFVAPVVQMKDWSSHLEIMSKSIKKPGNLEWPTSQMRKVINILPCHLVPNGYWEHWEDNEEYEKEWEIVFPKAEEFLLLHMMHAHIRCYFFVLALYKSFIESETNNASFGPKHLKHLLFWMVRKDFIGWPEDRPGECLLRYLNVLYKKLQDKSLPDFFIKTRNLFATSRLVDLHKAQAIIKMILYNPVPHIMKAVRNLNLEPKFYVTFDIVSLNAILRESEKREAKNKKKQKEKKIVRFGENEVEVEVQDGISQLSVDSIKTEEVLHFDSINSSQNSQILKMFTSHFVQMGLKSTEYKTLDQAKMYLTQVKIFNKVLTQYELTTEEVQRLHDEKNRLEEKTERLKTSLGEDIPYKESNATKSEEGPNIPVTQVRTNTVEGKLIIGSLKTEEQENKKIKIIKNIINDNKIIDEKPTEDATFETKL